MKFESMTKQAMWPPDTGTAFCFPIDKQHFGDKILDLESDFRKLGSVAVLRSLITILRVSSV